MSKYLILLMFLMACGADHDIVIEHPPSTVPEDEVPKEDTPDEPPESYVFDPGGFNRTLSTRALYDAEEIEVFFTDAKVITEELSFKDVLAYCIIKGATSYNHNIDKIGLLNGLFKDEGYTRDFLLNPDVERTWSRNGVALPQETINTRLHYEFSQPLSKAVSSSCTDSDGNTATCKKFLCGVDKGVNND